MPARLLVCATLIYTTVAAAMFGVLLPAVAVACGRPPLDGLFLWGRADAQLLADNCGSVGLDAYSHVAMLDLVYPLAFALCFGSWTLHLARVLGFGRRLTLLSLVPTAVNAASDYLENAAVWVFLREGPTSPSVLLDIGGAFSATKHVAGAVSLTAVAVLAVVAILVATRRRSVLS